jgi:hypothetical protein
LLRLALERPHPAASAPFQHVADAHQVLLRRLQAPLGLLAPRLVAWLMPAASSISARRSSGFAVTMSPMRPCSMIE